VTEIHVGQRWLPHQRTLKSGGETPLIMHNHHPVRLNIHLLPRRHLAWLASELPAESRRFLMDVRLDSDGIPWYGEHRAGIDGCFRFVRSN
jgi:hypothetical protein